MPRSTVTAPGSAPPGFSRVAVGGAAALFVLSGGLATLLLAGRWSGAPDGRIVAAFHAGLMAAAATALGTLPVLLSRTISQRASDAMLGFGAGVMLAATAFSLIVPALKIARDQTAGSWAAGSIVSVSIVLGAGLLLLIDRLVPVRYEVDEQGESASGRLVRRAWFFVLAISLHNMPEGLAIGVAFGGPDVVGAHALAAGISVQDVPEGLVVALALRSVGYPRLQAVGLGIASGLVEPLCAVFGAAAMSVSVRLLPWGLAAAAGAMLLVTCHDIIPEAHRKGEGVTATMALILGFVIMTLLDTALA